MYDAATLHILINARLAEDLQRAADHRTFRAARSRDGLRVRAAAALRRRAA